MGTDENNICNYLKSWPEEFLSSREICRRAAGKGRFREDPYWALPVLLQLFEQGILETDSNGHYRLAPNAPESKHSWIAPRIQQILQSKGDAPPVPETNPRITAPSRDDV